MLTPEEWQALRLSARVAFWATLVCLPLGTFVGWLLARRDFRGRFLLEALVQLPMVLPPVVPGYSLLLLLGTHGPIGNWLVATFGIVIAFTWKGAVIASAVMAFPLMVQPVRVAFRMIDVRLEQAATTLGATPWRAFLTITLPLALPGMLAGACCAFRAASASSARRWRSSATFPAKRARLPLAIYSFTNVPNGESAGDAARALSILLAVVALPSATGSTAVPNGCSAMLATGRSVLSIDVGFRRGAFATRAPRHHRTGVTGICGPSGCGKSTLLGLMAGLAEARTRLAVFRRRGAGDTATASSCRPGNGISAGVPGRSAVPAPVGAWNLLYGHRRRSPR